MIISIMTLNAFSAIAFNHFYPCELIQKISLSIQYPSLLALLASSLNQLVKFPPSSAATVSSYYFNELILFSMQILHP